MNVCEVAIPRGPGRLLTYLVPDGLDSQVEVGRRVLAPLGRGNKRVTAYVVGRSTLEKTRMRLKPVLDVLDGQPLFDPGMLKLFRFIARYYHAPLGDVIRTGLPGGLNITESRVAWLTEAGRAVMTSDEVLMALADGDRPIKELQVRSSRLVRLEKKGLIGMRYELERARSRPRFVSVVELTGAEPEPSLRSGAGPAVLLDILRSEGPLEVPSLSGVVKNHNAAVRRLIVVGAARLIDKQVFRDPWQGRAVEADARPTLTDDQKRAVDAIGQALEARKYTGFLLRGVTGSGKTEVYLHALEHALSLGRGGIVLVPEIALTPQLSGRFRARFGDMVAVLHSGLSDGERLDQWELIRQGKRRCVVGARSALFAPVVDLGIIMVDEEHEGSFKQDDSPRYHARDMALVRGTQLKIPVVLGSATPSLETVHNVDLGRVVRLNLPERIGGRAMPTVEIIDVRTTPMVDEDAMLSGPLVDAVTETVARGEQAILFLNRRGFASCLRCRQCRQAPRCVDCSVTLTLHRFQRRLSCHYCGYGARVPLECPECSGELTLGATGTEQVEDALTLAIPSARVARMDRDTTRGKALTRLLDRFRGREIDVLVGTQMVAKGHDFPAVTLVGVLLAEQSLAVQDFRAEERTFQLLTQVAGRAGRHAGGKVLIQTGNPDHYALKAAITHDSDGFVAHELGRRKSRGFPPFLYVALVRVDATKPDVAHDAAHRVARTINETIGRLKLPVHVVGPNPASLERLKGRTRMVMLLKSLERGPLHQAMSALDAQDSKLLGGARLAIDIDPINMM